ncbi:FecCD family ABC transporter permease [Sphingopyxis macrogoltabida]|uniref:ABC transporter permease n=1 Tax=Sphingopyxis macrogoltabida TaxID=33050 RepID=A0AAC9AXY2_SPHMC|nr:iron ABC transporter permease [Sphingopyxis macrogoltabida]ALJ15638.1 ABC transporter permease [Sphingopyxis macrogoltabida]AMU91878.1 ABC transporter permease [Sphingopyxis macrogoltabida]
MRRTNILLAVLLVFIAVAALMTGADGVAPRLLFDWATGSDPAAATIVADIRLPRVLSAAIVGAALAVCGAALQALTRNPLAEPGILGVSSGATLGATLTLYFGLSALWSWALPVGAIVGAGLVTALLASAAVRTRGMATLILIGVGLSSLTGALMALILNFAPNPFSLSDLVTWTLGSVANRSLSDLGLTVPFMAAGMALLLTQRRQLSLLSIGEEAAIAHGLDFRRTQLIVVIATGLATGASVALAGSVGFVGIVAPHLVRPWAGHDPGRTLVPAALAGAIMLIAADMLVRLLPTDTELRLGVVAALAGAPIFLLIVLRRGNVRHD